MSSCLIDDEVSSRFEGTSWNAFLSHLHNKNIYEILIFEH